MTDQPTYVCGHCGQHHEGPPLSYGSDAPAYWRDEFANDGTSQLSDEQCIIQGQHFFVRARIVIPIIDTGTEFDWGVWVTLSKTNFDRMNDVWTVAGREQEPPYSGWLSTLIPIYQPTTVNLKTHVHTQPVGKRPIVELERTDHPLAVEQRTGITLTRAQQIAEELLHPDA